MVFSLCGKLKNKICNEENPDLVAQGSLRITKCLPLCQNQILKYVMVKMLKIKKIIKIRGMGKVKIRVQHYLGQMSKTDSTLWFTRQRHNSSAWRSVLTKAFALKMHCSFSGSDCLHMFTSCTGYSLHILTTVSHGKTTICKGKYSSRFHSSIYFILCIIRMNVLSPASVCDSSKVCYKF